MNVLSPAIKIAKTHAKWLSYAIDHMKSFFPISAEKVGTLTAQEVLVIDMFVHRFSKLQDFMGNKLFDLILDKGGENLDGMTFIDKLNKLEKLYLIESADNWRDLRETRNHLAHEYPDKPDATAEYLNEAYDRAATLLQTLDNFVKFSERKL